MRHKQLKSTAADAQAVCVAVKPSRKVPDIAEDARHGLLSPPRSLPPKYFYDERGSRLFEQICQTPEYYPYRSEIEILTRYGKEIIDKTLPAEIMELGNGNSAKTRLLFNACEHNDHICRYVPLDICEPMLEDVTMGLRKQYPWLQITPLLGDYHAGLKHLPKIAVPRLYLFLGGTIGNFYPDQANDFIAEIKDCMRPGDYLLLGADRVKDAAVLNAAYNDDHGLTAAFNLNILDAINHGLDGNFNTAHFHHHATFNDAQNRVEMNVVCKHDHTVHLAKLNDSIDFYQDDHIRTEVSYKFTANGLESLLTQNGLQICQHYQADNEYFSLLLAMRT